MTAPTFHQEVVDLFAGPGGWSLACRRLGLSEIGIETDTPTRATRRAAGFATVQASVADLGPALFPRATTLIASPPCQTFSLAGTGTGHANLALVLAALADLVDGEPVAPDQFTDERTALVLQPLRWILEALALGRPFRYVALEQVPTVLPVWQAMGAELEALGYSVAVANLHAEQYGTPQTRKRAILVARLDGVARLPVPTHSRFHVRTPDRLDPGVKPWVPMAEALGWGMTHRPYPTLACSRSTGGPDREKVGGSAARAIIYREQAAGRWVMVNDRQARAAVRRLDQPAPTIKGGHSTAERTWVLPADPSTAPVRVSLEEVAALQTFPADFPWRGAASHRYQQVGNAIPPLLAEAVLDSLLEIQ